MMLQRCEGCGRKYVIGLLRCPDAGCGVMSVVYAPALAPAVPPITLGAPPERKPRRRRARPDAA